MALTDLISEDVINVSLTSDNKSAVLRELVQILKDAGKIDDFDAVLDAIVEREEKQSTGLELGIAVPHGKSASVKSLVIAMGISQGGIDFDSIDGKPAKLFFILVAPPNQPGPHVAALAEIAKLSQSSEHYNKILNTASAQEVIKLLHERYKVTF
jgi:fructose-specific phosphotransferase system IIA component